MISKNMKRSRTELVHSAVGSYLRKRQFTENETFKKNDLKLNQTTQEMATRGVILNESSVRNSVSFSSITSGGVNVDQQFIRLKSFITDAIEPFKPELTHILFPMFVHLYLELVCNGQKTLAQKFYQNHHALFLNVSKYNETVESLKKVVAVTDLSSSPNIKSFRESKYSVRLSGDTLQYLLHYLEENDNMLLLQIFTFYIEIKEPGAVHLHLYDDQIAVKEIPNNTNQQNSKSPDAKSSQNTSMKSLMQAIKKVRDGPPPFPSVCLYSIMNTARGVSCANLNPDLTLLAVGYEDSSIHLWNLTPQENTTSVKPEKDTETPFFACNTDKETQKRSSEEVKIMRGHHGTVHGLCFTPDSQLMLSCSEDTTVRAWDMETQNSVAIYRGHSYPVWDIDYSSVGIYFVTASHDRTAKLWMLDRTYPVRYFAGHSMDVDSVRFHPNCNYVATGSSDRTVRLWSVQEGKMVRMFQGHRGSIFTLAFSPNGQYLASAGEDRRIKIWDLAAGSLFKELRGHVDTVYSLCFNRDSSILVSGGMDNNVKVWDIRKGVNYNSGSDGHTSPELLGSCVTKSTNLMNVQYSARNLLVAVGMHPM